MWYNAVMNTKERLQQVEAQFSEAEEQIKTLENLRHQLIGQATILREIINDSTAETSEAEKEITVVNNS